MHKFFAALETRAPLNAEDREAILALPFTVARYDASAYLLREGEAPKRCIFVIEGFAFRQKITSEGARQILSLHMTGDFLDLQNLFLKVSDHSVQALTRCEVLMFDIKALQDIALSRPAVGRAMWVDALVDASMYREWLVNIGRRDARARIAHILCEFAIRMESAGVSSDDRYELPMTQEQLADTVGLTSVHVNRTLRSLVVEGLIQRERRFIRILDWDRLRNVGDFTARYLHLDQEAP